MTRLIQTGQARKFLENMCSAVEKEDRERRLWDVFLTARTEEAYTRWAEEVQSNGN